MRLMDKIKAMIAATHEPEAPVDPEHPDYRIIELVGSQLDRNATHLIVFDQNKTDKATANALVNNLRGNGVRATAVIVDGDPGKAIHVYSIADLKPDPNIEPVIVKQNNAATPAQRN